MGVVSFTVRLFYSYSHRDEAFRQELEAHLSFMRRSNLTAEWHDRKIDAGDEWKVQIDHYIGTADIVLLLISADFIASDYCWSEEMTKALARHERGEASVIPVILRPCRWKSTPLAKLQAVPKDAKAISEWSSRDAAFDDIAAAIERTVAKLMEHRCRATEQVRAEAEGAHQRAEAEAARLAAEQRTNAKAKEERQRLEAEANREAEELTKAEAKRKAEDEERRKVEEERKKAAEEETRRAATPFKARDTFRDEDDCPEMVVIPAGEFVMGSPESGPGQLEKEVPRHKVMISRPFAVGKYPVTFDEWDACVKAGGCKHKPDDAGWGRGRRPVIKVSWDDVQWYLAWLSELTGKPYRLLTEAEWEYAARAGRMTRYPWGDKRGTNRANFRDSGSPWSGKQTAPVGRFEPNAFGLYDMIGNVWEWVQDCWNEYLGLRYGDADIRDGHAWVREWNLESEQDRVVRGGSWLSSPRLARIAIRDRYKRTIRSNVLGFRIARTL
jgi:formylglycine-generating enzyme required for sulfatase activity